MEAGAMFLEEHSAGNMQDVGTKGETDAENKHYEPASSAVL